MNFAKWGARVANWKKVGAAQRPIEWHIAHLHSEVSEVFEALRYIQSESWPYKHADLTQNLFAEVYEKDGKPEGFGIELADVVLVALYLAEVTGIDIERQMEIKMTYNETKRARS